MPAENYLRIVKRGEVLKCCDPDAGDTPNFTAEERRNPVKLELMHPIEDDPKTLDFVIVQPTTPTQIFALENGKGTFEDKNLRLVSECVGLPQHVLLFWMDPDDYANLLAIVVEFNLNHLNHLLN